MEIDKINTYSNGLCNKRLLLEKKDSLGSQESNFEAFLLQSTLKCQNIDQHFMKECWLRPIESFLPCNAHNKPIGNLTEAPLGPVSNPIKESAISIQESNILAQDFIHSLWPFAKQAAAIIGLDPKLLLAQAALETGWGRFIARDELGESSNNLFNIKANKACDQSMELRTTEFIDGKPISSQGLFKKYSSTWHSFQDYISLIQNNPRYKTALANTNRPKDYLSALQQAGYATDPEYANKIWAIYRGIAVDAA